MWLRVAFTLKKQGLLSGANAQRIVEALSKVLMLLVPRTGGLQLHRLGQSSLDVQLGSNFTVQLSYIPDPNLPAPNLIVKSVALSGCSGDTSNLHGSLSAPGSRTVTLRRDTCGQVSIVVDLDAGVGPNLVLPPIPPISPSSGLVLEPGWTSDVKVNVSNFIVRIFGTITAPNPYSQGLHQVPTIARLPLDCPAPRQQIACNGGSGRIDICPDRSLLLVHHYTSSAPLKIDVEYPISFGEAVPIDTRPYGFQRDGNAAYDPVTVSVSDVSEGDTTVFIFGWLKPDPAKPVLDLTTAKNLPIGRINAKPPKSAVHSRVLIFHSGGVFDAGAEVSVQPDGTLRYTGSKLPHFGFSLDGIKYTVSK